MHNIEESYGSSTPQEVTFGSEPNNSFFPLGDSDQPSITFGVKAAPQYILKRRSETHPKLQTGALCTTHKFDSFLTKNL
jgi:hypothetical protein